jgi:hypothetical protein
MQTYKASKILTIFATDDQGFANLPSIYFQESNSKPQAFQLSHRDYFKKVRDYQGWLLDFSKEPITPIRDTYKEQEADKREATAITTSVFRNVYIQRLLNINDGTRGTTLSVPMHQPNLDNPAEMKVAGYVLGADIILPSVSLAPPSSFDFTFMVVDRNTGDVLFHTDENRSLVENLFYAGHGESSLSQWIRAGLDNSTKRGGIQIDGFYHGEAGHYTLAPTSVDDWAMVVFAPHDSIDSFMTNQFMYIFVTFLLLLGLILLTINITKHWTSSKWIKSQWGLPHSLDTKRVMLICTALFTTNYGLFYIGQLLQMSFPLKTNWHLIFSPVLPLLGIIILLVKMYRFYIRHFLPNSMGIEERAKFLRGAVYFSGCLWLTTILHFAYLQFSASIPLKGLQFHYSQQMCNGINKEHDELTKMALKHYPNSVTKQRIPPFELLPIGSHWPQGDWKKGEWQQHMLNKNSGGESTPDKCANYLSSIKPDDYPKMTTLVGSTFTWSWMKTYLFNSASDKAQQVNSESKNNLEANLENKLSFPFAWKWIKTKLLNSPSDEVQNTIYNTETNELISSIAKTNPEYDLILFSIAVLIALVWVWFYFNRKVLWPRIYCPSGFLKHIRELCVPVTSISHQQPSQKLVVHLDTLKLSGIGLTLLLRSQAMNDKEKVGNSEQEILPGFDHLYKLSPCMQMFNRRNTFLPNLKISLVLDETSRLLDVKIWDIETCLEIVEFRQELLDMIMEIKSLTMSGNLNSFTIYSGFMSLRRVKMKDPLASTAASVLEHAEYISWSECLVDFSVKITKKLIQNIDKEFLFKEIKNVPELHYLADTMSNCVDQVLDHTTEYSEGLWRSNEHTVQNTEWATIHYILLHADALYRFKWESCSCAEKLALYNLAKKHRLNPSNTEMIEHLAINGMIKVYNDHLIIVNKSFAHFVLHAETKETLNQLVQQGEAGLWKSYRLPLGMLIVLIIGGIALTSGQSIFIIAASLAGVLGTIGSLTSSAGMLKGQFRE